MDEELDLRAFFRAMARHWRIIALITVVALVAGGLAALLWPPEYQATATVAVTKPRYILDFDDRLRSAYAASGGTLPLGVIAANAYTALATNETLETRVLEELGWSMPLADLEKRVRIKADGGVILFTGKNSIPEHAANLANTWAQLYAEQLNTLFSSAAPNIKALEEQAGAARKALLQAEQSLAEFQSRSQITALHGAGRSPGSGRSAGHARRGRPLAPGAAQGPARRCLGGGRPVPVAAYGGIRRQHARVTALTVTV